MRGSQQGAEHMLTWTTFQTRQEETCKDLRGQISHCSPLKSNELITQIYWDESDQ